jgi:broad specificity phosphatase PhoE
MHPNVSTQFPDPHTSAGQQQQQQLHYNLLNLNSTGVVGSIPPTPKNIPNNNNNNNNNVNQPSSQTNETSQEEVFLRNLYNTISLRRKNPNTLHNTQRIRKRLSDSILNHLPQFSLLNNIHSQLQQQLQTNLNIQSEQNHNTLKHRHSFYFQRLSINPQQSSPIIECESQKLFIIRHGERVDSTFGVNWLDQVFDKTTGVYHRINLNLPKKMVIRKDFKDFLFDPPLTELGLHQCKIVGEELAAQGIQIDHIYSSPALRCIQTADKILEGLQTRDKISIRIEPCLFEFLKWYPVVPVQWPFLDFDELTQNGYNIDKSYKPFYPIESLRSDEDELMFYTRSHFITKSILKNHETNQGNLLIVGHVSLNSNKKKKYYFI